MSFTVKNCAVSQVLTKLDVRGSVHRSTIITEKKQQDAIVYQNLLFHIYMKLNTFRATHRPSGVRNCTSSLWFCIRERLLDVWLQDTDSVPQPHVQQPSTYAKPEAASAFLSS
jgi:hypothetical protein